MSDTDDLDGVPRLDDDELAALLADPSLWEDPPDTLEASVIAAVTAEVEAGGPSAAPVVHRRRRWLTPVVGALIGAAAAALVAVVLWQRHDDSTTAGGPHRTPVEMHGSDLAPQANGDAGVRQLPSGWAIDIQIPDLPWRDGTEYYQVWVRDCAKQYIVPAGSFHDLKDVVAWAGVSLEDFPLITVTNETLAPNGPDQASSGQVVASGLYHACPAT